MSSICRKYYHLLTDLKLISRVFVALLTNQKISLELTKIYVCKIYYSYTYCKI